MKKGFFFSMLFAVAAFASCTKTNEVTVDSAAPVGTFTATKSGALTAQNSTPTKGTASIGTDTKGTPFVKLGSDFTTELGTGTATLYLSTSATYKASPSTGNPDLKLVGVISKNGEQNFKLTAAPDAKFSYIIVWCGSAAIPFGNALLK
jgi:hypothetical protein